MPQLAFGHPEQGRYLVANVVWLFIIFGVLYFVMAQYALPAVGSVLEARRARIEGDLEQAQAAKLRADAAMADHQAGDRPRPCRGPGLHRQRGAAGAGRGRSQGRGAERPAGRADRGRRAAHHASRDSAMGALRSVAADTAEALVSRLTGIADRAAVDQAVGAELAARGRA